MRFIQRVLVLGSLFLLVGCTTQTTTGPVLDFDRYFVLDRDIYAEHEAGIFTGSSGDVDVATFADRTVFAPAFSTATVTLFTDGTLRVDYADDWFAVCPASGNRYDCTSLIVDHDRMTEVEDVLYDFHDVTLMPVAYYPLADYPEEPLLAPWQVLVLVVLGLVVFYVSVGILFTPAALAFGDLSRKPRIANVAAGRGIGAKGGAQSAQSALGNMFLARDAGDDVTAEVDEHPDGPDLRHEPPLSERIRRFGPLWLAAVGVFLLVLVLFLTL